MSKDKTLIRQTAHRIIVRLYLKDDHALISVLYEYVLRNGNVFTEDVEDLNDPNLDIQSEWIGDKFKLAITLNE